MWPVVALRSTPRRLFGSKRPEHCDLELWGVARWMQWTCSQRTYILFPPRGAPDRSCGKCFFFRPTMSPAETQRTLTFSMSCVPWTPPSLVSPSHLGGPSPPPALGHWGVGSPLPAFPSRELGTSLREPRPGQVGQAGSSMLPCGGLGQPPPRHLPGLPPGSQGL